MRFFLLVITVLFLSCEKQTKEIALDFPLTFETSNGQETATYREVIDFYKKLAKEFPEINIQTIGETDSGIPLHLVTFNVDGDFNFKKITKDKTVLLINNGIHPGESDGIDATMMLYRDLASKKLAGPKNTVVATIPIYNIGGALNRNSSTRANQNGPKSYGFRGNARNYDLNRDFIKNDTKNAKTFAKIFHMVNPDVFIDNHVSNGADYQYTLTHLFTQHNKLGGALGSYLDKIFMPKLVDSLASNSWEITPYVNVFNKPPENGFQQFMDHPRYSTGYTTLWNTLGLMVETHMLKPYKQRVEGTYAILLNLLKITDANGKTIRQLRSKANEQFLKQKYYPISYMVDSSKGTVLNFKGYKADTLISSVTGLPRLKYDRKNPITFDVDYYNYFQVADSVRIPEYYIVKKEWQEIITLLDLNEIEYRRFKKDTVINAEAYRIEEFNTVKQPYEGHYLHFGTKTSSKSNHIAFKEGDYLIPTSQPGFRYIMETLEPSATDSFFNWNFFDTILQQKEGFSPYVFEDEALEILEKDSILKLEFDSIKKTNKEFSENWYTQLNWLFKKSKHYEAVHRQYPIYRILPN
jgi:hypothetical protein